MNKIKIIRSSFHQKSIAKQSSRRLKLKTKHYCKKLVSKQNKSLIQMVYRKSKFFLSKIQISKSHIIYQFINKSTLMQISLHLKNFRLRLNWKVWSFNLKWFKRLLKMYQLLIRPLNSSLIKSSLLRKIN